MIEKIAAPLVVVMMAVAGIYAFSAHPSGGITGAIIATGQDNSYDCFDTDGDDQYTAGITASDFYPEGFAKDSCVGNDVLEYYCTEDGPAVRGVSCTYGCFAEACRRQLE